MLHFHVNSCQQNSRPTERLIAAVQFSRRLRRRRRLCAVHPHKHSRTRTQYPVTTEERKREKGKISLEHHKIFTVFVFFARCY